MKPIILLRNELDLELEYESAKKYFEVESFRTNIPENSLVIGRYSVLPFYKELEDELIQTKHAKLINTHEQHSFIADIMSWGSFGGCLHGLTPQTWDNWSKLPDKSFVLKGKTNSRKHQWNTHMFAPTRNDVPIVAKRLMDDSLINEQGIVVREYVPLRKLDVGINGLPITNEWRSFWISDLKGKVSLIEKGFYWSSFPEKQTVFPEKALKVLHRAAQMIGLHASFFVLDIAEKEDGDWIIIEVNDGQMSGLSMINPDRFYYNLSEVFKNE